jgi:hypothetical protein
MKLLFIVFLLITQAAHAITIECEGKGLKLSGSNSTNFVKVKVVSHFPRPKIVIFDGGNEDTPHYKRLKKFNKGVVLTVGQSNQIPIDVMPMIQNQAATGVAMYFTIEFNTIHKGKAALNLKTADFTIAPIDTHNLWNLTCETSTDIVSWYQDQM